jgi:hypothetical protein
MPSQGPTLPGTGADDSSIGATAWTNPGQITADDGSFAFCSIFGTTSHYLKGTNFGFTIPAGATINGIVVEWKRQESQVLTTDNAVRVVKAGTIGSTDRSSGTNWPSTSAYNTYGSSSDLWGDTWGPSDINDTGFGSAISANSNGNLVTAQSDAVRITVYYTPATFPGDEDEGILYEVRYVW